MITPTVEARPGTEVGLLVRRSCGTRAAVEASYPGYSRQPAVAWHVRPRRLRHDRTLYFQPMPKAARLTYGVFVGGHLMAEGPPLRRVKAGMRISVRPLVITLDL